MGDRGPPSALPKPATTTATGSTRVASGVPLRVLVGALLAAEAVRLLLQALEAACRARGSERFSVRLRKRLFGVLLGKPLSYFDCQPPHRVLLLLEEVVTALDCRSRRCALYLSVTSVMRCVRRG